MTSALETMRSDRHREPTETVSAMADSA